jgi:hypothetical protein
VYAQGVRPLALAFSLFAVGLVVAACDSDDSSSSSTQTGVPPSSCAPEPCTVGKICYGPTESTCNGTWYCWSDGKWYCAPQDAGGPGGPPPDAGTPGLDATVPDGATSGADAPAG